MTFIAYQLLRTSAWTFSRTAVFERCLSSATGVQGGKVRALLTELRKLDTACLCDADKSIRSLLKSGDEKYNGLKVLDQSIRPLNSCNHAVAAGAIRTVQCTEPNDLLAVLRGLEEAEEGEVLVVNTMSSTRAVAGELFCAEAQRKGLCAIIVDGPMRDSAYLEDFSVRCFSSSVTPYSGTIQSVGKMQESITCGGIKMGPGEIAVADDDGIVVGTIGTFESLIPVAKMIQETEANIRAGITNGTELVAMTNFKDHLKKRLAENESALEFHIK
jgi:4-hydroxy-4-methyl-2-oxoglutarate aldolase